MAKTQCTYNIAAHIFIKTKQIIIVYINQQDAQISVIKLYFSIRCSTCFGLY